MIMTGHNVTKQNQYLLTYMFILVIDFRFSDIIKGSLHHTYPKLSMILIKVIKINILFNPKQNKKLIKNILRNMTKIQFVHGKFMIAISV